MTTHFCKAGLSSNQLKLIAIIAMTVDHLTWAFFPGCQHHWWLLALHAVGRLTAPIMWFFIAEGFAHTQNRKKYAGRLFLFALISHFAYNFAGGIPFLPHGMFNQTSVMWSLAWSVVLMDCYENGEIPQWKKLLFTAFVCFITFPSDWSCIAVMCPVFLHSHRGDFKKQAADIIIWTCFYAVVYFFAIDRIYAVLQLCTALSIPLLRLYNGQRGSCKSMKWLFYWYYPPSIRRIPMTARWAG